MNDALKHTVGTATTFAGLLASIHFADVQAVLSIATTLVGLLAGVLTCLSWFKINRKK